LRQMPSIGEGSFLLGAEFAPAPRSPSNASRKRVDWKRERAIWGQLANRMVVIAVIATVLPRCHQIRPKKNIEKYWKQQDHYRPHEAKSKEEVFCKVEEEIIRRRCRNRIVAALDIEVMDTIIVTIKLEAGSIFLLKTNVGDNQ
jgi:hypothetical protein